MKEFKTEARELMKLVVDSIYTNHEVFLRELISNASDALDKARLVRADEGDEGSGDDQGVCPEIHVSFDRDERTLIVSDTGVGMDERALEECLGTIAHSGSRVLKERAACEGSSAGAGLIGQFGVGFYSAFMVADRVRVISRAMGSDEAFEWESGGVDGYTVRPAQRERHGTDVILHVRPSTADENLERYLDQTSLVNLIKRYSNYIRYPITMDLADEFFDEERGVFAREEGSERTEVVNSTRPLWTLDEKDVSLEEMNEFYRFEFRDALDPLLTVPVHARGALAYDALLFVPQVAPAELYAKDHRYGLKLYSAGVLVDECCECLVSSHLRFVQGIVDTRNVSLNVSREAVQEDGRLQIIARQLERSLIEGLRRMLEDDRVGYERFFREFGTGLKYALCTSGGALTNILNDFLLYHSAKKHRLVTLQEYLDASGDVGSKNAEVLYAVGSDIGRLEKAPTVQVALEQGRDVLLCPNGAQDEVCFMLMGTYKGARFRSVTSAQLDLEGSEGAALPVEEDGLRAPTLDAICRSAPQPLIRVVASKHLTRADEAASRVATEGAMTISLARYLTMKRASGQAIPPLYVLEVNVGHVLFARAKRAVERGDEKTVADCAAVLLGQALLVEDIPLADPVAFSKATNALLRACGTEGAVM